LDTHLVQNWHVQDQHVVLDNLDNLCPLENKEFVRSDNLVDIDKELGLLEVQEDLESVNEQVALQLDMVVKLVHLVVGKIAVDMENLENLVGLRGRMDFVWGRVDSNLLPHLDMDYCSAFCCYLQSDKLRGCLYLH